MSSKNDLVLLSNELEFWLEGITAKEMIDFFSDKVISFDLDPEVNPRDAIEIIISKAKTLQELNRKGAEAIKTFYDGVCTLGGKMFGGSLLPKETNGLQFTPYRTTALSVPLGEGLKNLANYQILFGLKDFKSANLAYETLRQIGPVILALAASSPYRINSLRKSDKIDSRRIAEVYPEMFREFPSMMWGTSGPLKKIEDLFEIVARSNVKCHKRYTEGGFTIDPRFQSKGFEIPTHLAPHQFYWTTRPRFDHATLDQPKAALSLEFRLADMPLDPSQIAVFNSYLVGLISYALELGEPIMRNSLISREELSALETGAAIDGLESSYKGIKMRDYAKELLSIAEKGLDDCSASNFMYEGIEKIIKDGNDSTRLRRNVGKTDSRLIIDYATEQLDKGIKKLKYK